MFLPRRTIAIHPSRYLLGLLYTLWGMTFCVGLVLLPKNIAYLFLGLSILGTGLATYQFLHKKGLFVQGWLHIDEQQLYWQAHNEPTALPYTWHKSSRFIDGLMVIHLRHSERSALRLVLLADSSTKDDLRHLRVWWRWH